jgi:predicted RNA binding protein YcfA (HicA-like mRNA interferase family)
VSKVPSLSYTKIISALQRDGWVKVHQQVSHIRLEKKVLASETLKITVPASPINFQYCNPGNASG